ncbi:MAG TPA: PHP domain-containing protein [Pyrinomonadaceae bacterium]|jgi:DNA polymerase (family 10)|nr:PHP domain-containing protein [Pyrinomonadaceae bacterium]
MAEGQKPQLDRFGVAAGLQEIAQLMELKGGQYRFKAKAYNAGARAIQAVADLDRLVREDRLTTLPRIGDALASQIKQLYLTGESSVLTELRKEFPTGIVELSGVPGLGVDKIRQLQDELGITSIAELKAAAEAGKLQKLKGFGPKTEQRLLTQLATPVKKPKRRLHLHHAWSTADQAIEYLKAIDGVVEVSVAGSLRRWEETVDVVDLVASTNDPAELIERFLQFPLVLSSQIEDENTCVAEFADGAQVWLTAVPPKEFALTLFVKTGSQAHLEKVKEIAERKKVSFVRLPRTEAQLYSRLGMAYIPPELREDHGEIEAALAKKIPEDLVTDADIKGVVHCHTTYSDGVHTLDAMVRGAEAMGMKYITITDHSPTAMYANGLKVDRLKRQWDEIDELQEKVSIKILRGTESDIIATGKLDYPDSVLEKFDVIVASIHARYKMDSAKMTERITTAMREPVFKIWGHGLGRLLQRRPPFDCDVERILDVISESRAAIEINGDPYRLDLEPRWVREARKRKIKFVISTDAHSVKAMNNVKYGVAMARRGWVTRKEVLNTLSPAGFAKAVKPV